MSKNSICPLCDTEGKLVLTGHTAFGIVSEYRCCGSEYVDFGEALAEIEAVGHVEIRWDDESYEDCVICKGPTKLISQRESELTESFIFLFECRKCSHRFSVV